ncbi:MAG: PaaI family thioesterase [Solirubrobacterales bacterium]
MRSIGRRRAARRGKAPRIAISQAEITADLHYPAPVRAEPLAAERAAVSAEPQYAPEATAQDVAEAFAAVDSGTSRSRTLVWQDPVPTAATMTGIEYMEAIASGQVPPPPIAVTMRLRPVELGEGRCVFEGEPGEEHYNPIGAVHGGYAATLLDSALGCAVHTTLPAGVGYTSLGLEVKFVRPITRDTGRVLCEANVLHRGRRQATSEAQLTAAASGKLLAHGIATCMILG